MQIVTGNFSRISQRIPIPRPPMRRPVQSQTPSGYGDPAQSFFNSYMPLKDNIDLYGVIREQIPFIDSAIIVLTRLVGDFEIDTNGKDKLKDKIDAFIENVQVNWYDRSLWSFKDELCDSAFETGVGFGELVPMASMTDVHRLKTCNAKHFCWIEENGRLYLAIYRKGSMLPEKVSNEQLVYYLAWDKRQGHPQGKSLIQSCVTSSQIVFRWMKSFDNYIWRFGDPSIAAELTIPENLNDAEYEYYRNSIVSQLQGLNKLRRQGQVGDLVGGVPGGSVNFKTLGADAPIGEHEASIRTILEGIISKTGLPPEFLGLSWSSTERMSQYKADKLQATIKQQRKRLTPIMKNIIDTYLILTGSAGESYEIKWNDILLLDETEQSRAHYMNQFGNEKLIMNISNMVSMGWMDQEAGEEALRTQGVIKNKMPDDWVSKTKSKMFLKEIVRENL